MTSSIADSPLGAVDRLIHGPIPVRARDGRVDGLQSLLELEGECLVGGKEGVVSVEGLDGRA